MPPTELIYKFNLKRTFLQAVGIMHSIPISWKLEIRKFSKPLPVVKSQNIDRLFRTKRVTSFTYGTLRQLPQNQLKFNVNGTNIFRLWLEIGQLLIVFLPYIQVLVKLRSFQLRIFHRIIGTNVLLIKMGTKDRNGCFFCDCKPD